MADKHVIGIDVGGTKVAYGLFAPNGMLLDRYQHPTDSNTDGEALSDAMLLGIAQMLKKNGLTPDDVLGIGVGMPSFILFDEGYIFLTSALTNIRDFAMRDYLQARLPVRFVLDNDSNAAALAEHRYGAGRGNRHMVYMSASTGLGSGLILDGKLFRGSYGWAGECGHMIATPDEGIECGCRNRGCFMSWASGRYAPEHAKQRIKAGETSVLSDSDDLDCAKILEAYNQGDVLAITIVEQMAKHMATCAFNVYQLLNINLFVFGGGLVNFGDALFGRIRREFDSLNHIEQPVFFRLAELKQDFGIIGAAALVCE